MAIKKHDFMIDGLIVKTLDKNQDERGWLIEIFRNDSLNFNPAMAYISLTKPGIVRGPHEHKQQTDFFVFAGPGDFQLHLWDKREHSRTEGEYVKINGGESNPIIVIVPPGIVHGYKCVSASAGWCLNFPDKLYKGRNKSEGVDEIRWENEKNSIYKIV